MCGFAGMLSIRTDSSRDDLISISATMVETLRHRGPDDDGIWVDPPAGIALAFRRLSIVDLSPQGHQPMVLCNGRYVIAFNGEMYNHAGVRSAWRRQGRWVSRPLGYRGPLASDRMLGLGVGRPAQRRHVRLRLWDREERRLHLVRDRLGEKPLYYGWIGDSFLFGSELKMLQAYPGFERGLGPDGLAQFVRYGYIPRPTEFRSRDLQAPSRNDPDRRSELFRERCPEGVAYWSLDRAMEYQPRYSVLGIRFGGRAASRGSDMLRPSAWR